MELVLPNLELYAPVTLRGTKLSDREFLEFCADHEDLRVESNEGGEIEIMPGTGPETGKRNLEIAMQLGWWTKLDGRGSAFDSSTLFVVPSGARRSPDASWIAKSRIAGLPPAQRGHLWQICPEFVIELRSPSDRLPLLEAKMREWIASGAQLGWFIDPDQRTVTVYRPQSEPEVLIEPAKVSGEGPIKGFVLDLADIWLTAD
jgi:Uma2 family endonuclease